MHLLFCLQLAAVEIALRGPSFYAAHPRAIAYLGASVAILHLLSTLRARPARIAIAILIGAAISVQVGFYRYYHAPIDDQVAVAARLAWADVRRALAPEIPALVAVALAVAAIELAWISRAPPKKARQGLAAIAIAVGVAAGGPLRHGTLEIREAQAATAFALATSAREKADRPRPPPLTSRRARVPNILFIVTESVRASDYCGDPAAPCPFAPEVSALLPDRTPLFEMRSVSSYTAISLSVLLTGLPQIGSRAPIAAAPDLFDLVHATRADGRPVAVHYWSSQSPSFFERSDASAAVDSFISADTLLGHPLGDLEEVPGGLDGRLGEECKRRMPSLESPYLLMLHLFDTHTPYYFDEDRASFRPFGRTISWRGMEDLHRAYQNAIVSQDRALGVCLRAFLDAQRGAPHFVIFTSDHGEAFGEHGAIHHGQSLYDEQIHVPAFIAARGGAITAEEARALAAQRTEFVSHFDVLPTILDALGVLDHFAIARDRAKMPGRSLLRPSIAEASPMPVTNCSEMWQCPLDTWGVLSGDRKLIEQAWDGQWRCLSIRGGEREEDLGRCQDLVRASKSFFARRPDGSVNE